MATEQVRVFRDGVLVDTYDVEVPDEEVRRRTIEAQAVTALANNTAYLAVNNPNTAQVVAQVNALTRQTNKIIRLILGRLESTD